MNSVEIKRLNRQLKAVGRRICPTCEANLELNDANFYRSKGQLNGSCKTCRALRRAARWEELYHADPDFNDRQKAYDAKYRNRPEIRERKRVAARERMRRIRRQRIAKILGKAG